MSAEKSKKYAVIVGARPNFVKAAPFFHRAKEYPNLKFKLIHTGQHFDANMSKIFFDQMGIPLPDINLNIKGEFHTEKIGKMFDSLKIVLGEMNPDGVIVFGDINSTLAGAVAAAKNNFKLIHVESGLRSHDRRMPEEINRVIVDHLSDILFTSETDAKHNLIKEGVSEDKIKEVGNVMIESLELFSKEIDKSQILDNVSVQPRSYIVATIHRSENTDDEKILSKILSLLKDVGKKTKIVLPLHPGTKVKINNYGIMDMLDNINVIDPLGYFDFLKLVKESGGVVTDSGGIQEETSHLGVPCVTLRDNTERPVTIEFGTNILLPINQIGADSENFVFEHLQKTFKPASIPLWDNNVTKRIFAYL